MIVKDKRGSRMIMQEEEWEICVTPEDVARIMSNKFPFPEDASSKDIDIVIHSKQIYAYLGDMLIRYYYGAESLFFMQCYFEESLWKEVPVMDAKTLAVYTGITHL